ncbi:hypothetical protein [Epilithonimonas hungarica]|jgi:hypothetical protein|uniref:Uncharacterized protein n=1 Tax=Epilithonimonas hungarica TaxID=454006 RepID=A0A1G7PAR9_9FLAO|nr:hypothetical protein [Epilithonimonas hungarica]MPT30559.1 hypothetical protein [Chryseobacterium sp.]SDF83314.1 hypothetical protein SAMN05421825_2237 [Epilithonimonas hungarica]
MKGILKIYHPEETLKYFIDSTYCKSVYSNKQNFLEVEVITNDSLDHVEDDSLQYNFPQISLNIFDFPITTSELEGQTFSVEDTDDDSYTEVDLFDDEEAFLFDNELKFDKNDNDDLQLCWTGKITDFYTGSENPIEFKLKCHFRPDEIEVDD